MLVNRINSPYIQLDSFVLFKGKNEWSRRFTIDPKITKEVIFSLEYDTLINEDAQKIKLFKNVQLINLIKGM